jgi:hypothetical protein
MGNHSDLNLVRKRIQPMTRTTRHALVAFTATLLLAALYVADTSGKERDLTAADHNLRHAFRAPPAEFRPLIITHSKPLDRDHAIEGLAARRAGGAVLDVGVTLGSRDLSGERWNNSTYLNDPARFQKLRDVVVRIKQEGLRVWLYDELGYPSGSAGGRVLEGHPEFQVEVVGCRTTHVSKDETVLVSPGLGVVVACYALPRHDNALKLEDAVDLTVQAKTGKFEWRAPGDGQWSVCLFERFHPDTWRRHNIPRRNVNILDRRVVSRFIELTHAQYATELGKQLADVDLFFTDEPQFGSAEHWGGGNTDCTPMIQWCDELPVAFQKRKGYDLVETLPALFHQAGPKTSKFRYDFYDTQSDLVAENYFGQIQDWCREQGVASSGHMLLEESLLFHLIFSGSMTKNWALQDLPGVDQLVLPRYKTMAGWEGSSGIRVKEDFSVKMAASIAALTGKRGVFSESFALCNHAKVPDLARAAKGMAAWQFACGVTHMCTYTLQQRLSPEAYAGVADFVGRLALLSRRGRPVSDVAVLVPEASVWAFFNPPNGGTFKRYIECNPQVMQIDDAFREACHQLLAHQRDFEVLTEQLLSEATVNKGWLELAGQRFAFLVLPEARMLSETSMQKIEDFAASGGHVIFTGSLPSLSPAKGEDPAMHKRVVALIRSNADRMRFVEEESRFGETVSWMAGQVPPEIRWNGAAAVRLAHQREPTREIILVANPGAAAAGGELVCAFGGSVSIWNPETGEIREAGTRKRGEAVSVAVPADSARFVVFWLSDQE